MAGRQHPPTSAGSSNNGSNTSSSRKGKTHEEDTNGVKREKGLNGEGENGARQLQSIARQTDDGSDGDELGDSESERAETDQSVKRKQSTTASTTTSRKATPTGRGRGRPSNSSSKANAITASTAKTGRASSSLVENRQSPYSGGSVQMTEKISLQKQVSPPTTTADGINVSKTSQDLPRETPKTTTTTTASSSTSAPYYYNQSSATSSKHTPRDTQFKQNRIPSFTSMTDGKAASASSAPVNDPDDLTMLEVDKFLDLIEKHNLHTSNEDDMARSVTELYQEWLEWCAKRSVQSTKSKQALVAEFVRIHQGEYGRLRQQRAMEIVKGRAGGSQDVDRNPLTTEQLMPPSKSTSLFPKYEDDIRDGHKTKSLSASIGSKRLPSGAATSSQYIHVPSPSIAPRALTPGPTSTFQQDSQSQYDSLHRRVREEVWKDASIMIERVVHEQMTVMMEKNRSLRGRVEQLEIHSDNLAQWIQHLNRVQDELTLSIQTAATAQPTLREEVVVVEEPINKYSRQPIEQQRTYAPTYQIGPTSTQSSPKRSYAVRRSPSPPIIIHHSSAATSRRPIPSTQRDPQSRDTREYRSGGGGGGTTRVATMSDPYDRPYYSYPAEDREQHQHAPPLPSHSPHQLKRPRNGY